jgi:hypothetical protein
VRFLCVALYLLAITSGFSKPAKIQRYDGFLVLFKNYTEFSKTEISNLKTKFHLKLAYQARVAPVQWLRARSQLSKHEIDEICSSFIQSSAVLNCDPNYPIQVALEHSGEKTPQTQNKKDCQLVDFPSGAKASLDGRLTPLWAQTLVGADLVRKESQTDEFKKNAQQVPLALLDSGVIADWLPQDKLAPGLNRKTPTTVGNPGVNHGTIVANLILDSEFGMGAPAKLVFAENLEMDLMKRMTSGLMNQGDFVAGLDKLNIKGAKLANFSVTLGADNASVRKSLQNLAAKGTILVAATGNVYPGEVQYNVQRLPGVLVGSLTPFGIVSSFSQETEETTITAPSDGLQLAKEKELIKFGGTSGATPLVTGSIAYALALLPDLNYDEVRVLLSNTAIHTTNSRQKPVRKNGAGMLNSLKLLRVAEKLQKENFSKLSPKERMEKLQETELYDFNSLDLEERTQKAFQKFQNNNEDLCEKRAAFDELRTIFLLTESDSSRKILSDIYKGLGFEMDALFYQGLTKDPEEYKKVLHAIADIRTTEKSSGGQNLEDHFKISVVRAYAQEGQLLNNLDHVAEFEKKVSEENRGKFYELLNETSQPRYVKTAEYPDSEMNLETRQKLLSNPNTSAAIKAQAVRNISKYGHVALPILKSQMTKWNFRWEDAKKLDSKDYFELFKEGIKNVKQSSDFGYLASEVKNLALEDRVPALRELLIQYEIKANSKEPGDKDITPINALNGILDSNIAVLCGKDAVALIRETIVRMTAQNETFRKQEKIYQLKMAAIEKNITPIEEALGHPENKEMFDEASNHIHDFENDSGRLFDKASQSTTDYDQTHHLLMEGQQNKLGDLTLVEKTFDAIKNEPLKLEALKMADKHGPAALALYEKAYTKVDWGQLGRAYKREMIERVAAFGPAALTFLLHCEDSIAGLPDIGANYRAISCVKSVLKIGGAEAKDTLERWAKSENPFLKEAAAYGLQKLLAGGSPSPSWGE